MIIMDNHTDDDLEDSQPSSLKIWEAPVTDNSNPLIYLFSMVKLTLETSQIPTSIWNFEGRHLCWFMNLPRHSIIEYSDFHRKLIHQFSWNKCQKVTTTSLLTISKGYSESLREYLFGFNEVTIKVCNPNQEMFMGEFQIRLKDGHFNESLAHKYDTFATKINKAHETKPKHLVHNHHAKGHDIDDCFR